MLDTIALARLRATFQKVRAAEARNLVRAGMATRRIFGEEEVEVTVEGTSSAAAVEAVVREPSPKVLPESEDDDVEDSDGDKEGDSEGEEEVGDDRPSKDSHLTFGVSTVMERSFESYKEKGYHAELKHC